MSNLTNYNETYTQITAQLSAALRTKAPAAPFTYGVHEYNVKDRDERIALVDRISADYIEKHAEYTQRTIDDWREETTKFIDGKRTKRTKERPATIPFDSALLERLADAILNEELTDTYRGKSTHVEYPFLSERQFTTRHNGEVGLKSAEEVGTDGRNYAVPARRKRRSNENNSVDARAKSRNKERAAQYRKDTAAGRLVTYNLNDTGGELTEEFVLCKGVRLLTK